MLKTTERRGTQWLFATKALWDGVPHQGEPEGIKTAWSVCGVCLPQDKTRTNSEDLGDIACVSLKPVNSCCPNTSCRIKDLTHFELISVLGLTGRSKSSPTPCETFLSMLQRITFCNITYSNPTHRWWHTESEHGGNLWNQFCLCL